MPINPYKNTYDNIVGRYKMFATSSISKLFDNTDSIRKLRQDANSLQNKLPQKDFPTEFKVLGDISDNCFKLSDTISFAFIKINAIRNKMR